VATEQSRRPGTGELARHVFRAPHLVDADVEREELAQSCCLHLDQLLGLVGRLEGQHVEAQAIADGLRNPVHLAGQVVSAFVEQPLLLKTNHELLTEPGQLPILRIPLCKVDSPALVSWTGMDARYSRARRGIGHNLFRYPCASSALSMRFRATCRYASCSRPFTSSQSNLSSIRRETQPWCAA
jgi:hypothetical protein